MSQRVPSEVLDRLARALAELMAERRRARRRLAEQRRQA